MKKHMTQEAAIKSAWMILEGLGYDRARNGDLEKTVTAVYESAPAADVVEVVRCRECYFRELDGEDSPVCTGAMAYSYMPDDWYCASGKRKDGGQDE